MRKWKRKLSEYLRKIACGSCWNQLAYIHWHEVAGFFFLNSDLRSHEVSILHVAVAGVHISIIKDFLAILKVTKSTRLHDGQVVLALAIFQASSALILSMN